MTRYILSSCLIRFGATRYMLSGKSTFGHGPLHLWKRRNLHNLIKYSNAGTPKCSGWCALEVVKDTSVSDVSNSMNALSIARDN